MNYHIIAFLLSLAFQISGDGADLRTQPNVIVVMLDDLGYETAIQGDSIKYVEGGPYAIEMPNLRDKILLEGLVLDNAFASPVCSPSRVQMMTGKYLYKNNHQFGHINWNSRTLAQELLRNGYHTAIAGKWQLHGNTSFPSVSTYDEDYNVNSLDNPHRLGYSQFLLHSIQGNSQRYANCANYIDENGIDACGSGDYGPDVVFNYFAEFVNQRKDSNRPFFFDYRMNLPHDPFEPSPDHPNYPMDTVNNARYLPSMLKYTDKVLNDIKTLIDTTPELHEGYGTVLMILSDNGSSRGWINNNPGGIPALQWGIFTQVPGVGEFNGNKSISTYLGCHIPAVVYYVGPYKKYSDGQHYTSPFGLIDVYPTVMDLARLSHVNNTDGVSIADEIVSYTDSVPNREALFQYFNPFFPGLENSRSGTNINSFVTDGKYWLDSYDRFYDIIDSLDWELLTPISPISQAQIDAYNTFDSILQLHPRAQDFNKPLLDAIPPP